MTAPYEIIPHTADVGVVTLGGTLAEVISNIGRAMFDIGYDLEAAPRSVAVEFRISADSETQLLVDVLSELLYRSERDDMVFADVAVQTEDLHATVTATGGSAAAFDPVGPPIKAITYHELECEPVGDGWRARVIFDV